MLIYGDVNYEFHTTNLHIETTAVISCETLSGISLKIKSFHDANFVITGGTKGCHYVIMPQVQLMNYFVFCVTGSTQKT